MNKHLVGITIFGAVFGGVGVALAQLHHASGQSLARTKSMVPLTPAQKARHNLVGQLDEAAKEAINSGNYVEAEADARRSMATGSDSGLAQETLAAALYAQGKDQEALQVYQEIAHGGAYAAGNEWPYAMLLLKAGRWAQAVEAYKTALQLGGDVDVLRANSDFSSTLPQTQELAAAIHIGMAMTMAGGDFHGTYQERCQQALAHFQRALALEPDSALAHYYHGHGLWRLGRKAEARAAFQKAAALDQDGGDVRAAVEREKVWR